ncbi:alpha/beta hydrolase [Paraburkholderia acidicola]|uniref:Alpha/beta hydrolase n=1 Tax=Paraburkholderia acidicola TaxID=1912599 RepID=A0A2A4F0L0_9BURK|nr:alpha/beta fold hydrolase [Paraburkholderia acidicola]PCE26114.1 alpha/beta hydrolase [Paraburkholderia acidicola]
MPTTSYPVRCADGFLLEVTTHQSERTAKAVVQINPATAVTERMYFAFAEHLVANGFDVVTYNYRGVGKKGPHPKSLDAGFMTWADQDVEAVTRWTSERYQPVPHLVVGHSFGGHAIGLSASSQLLSGAVMICAHAGCLRFIRPWSERLRVALLLKVLGPLCARTIGFAPGRKLGIGEDLPGQIMLDWSRWTSLPRYFFDDPETQALERFRRPSLPILSLGMSDDRWAPVEAIDLIAGQLSNCQVERRQFNPSDSRNQPIGHLGFFRRHHADTLWPIVTQWLEQHTFE